MTRRSISGNKRKVCEQPSSLTVHELKDWLVEHNIPVPAKHHRKQFYVDLVEQHLSHEAPTDENNASAANPNLPSSIQKPPSRRAPPAASLVLNPSPALLETSATPLQMPEPTAVFTTKPTTMPMPIPMPMPMPMSMPMLMSMSMPMPMPMPMPMSMPTYQHTSVANLLSADAVHPPVYGYVATSARNMVDPDHFKRCPSRLPGARPCPSSAFPGKGQNGYVYAIQRLSDMAYACQSFCDAPEGTASVRYSSFKRRNIVFPCILWLPHAGLDAYVGDHTIIDTVHTDLLDPSDGSSRFNSDMVIEECGPHIKSVFLNNMTSADALQTALRKCEGLQVLVLSESTVNLDVWHTIAETCAHTLEGLHLWNCETDDDIIKDEDIAELIKKCPKLKWLCLSMSEPQKRFDFSTQSWSSLPDALQVLWLQTNLRPQERSQYAREHKHMIEEQVTRLSKLKLIMVHPSIKLESMV